MSSAASPRGTAPSPGTEDGLPMPRRIWAVMAISLAIILSVLDGTLANVALPTIAPVSYTHLTLPTILLV